MDNQGNMIPPFLNFNRVFSAVRNTLSCQVLWIVDACCSGIAGIDNEVELIGASSWSDSAAASRSLSFTRFLIDALKMHNGSPVSAVELMSYMIYDSGQTIMRASQPILRPAKSGDEHSVIFHCISPFPPESPKHKPGKWARVIVSVTVNRSDTVPDRRQFERWLTTHVPPGLRDMQITIGWETTSTTILVEMPYEVWVYLPDRLAYNFVSYVKRQLDFGSTHDLAPRTTGKENVAFGARPSPGAGPSGSGKQGGGTAGWPGVIGR